MSPPKRLNPATQRCNGGASQWRRLAFCRRKHAIAVKDEKLFPGESELPNRACPTTGSDRGSLRDHDLTLIVSHHGDGSQRNCTANPRPASARATTAHLNASAFAPEIGPMPTALSNSPGLASSTVAIAPLIINAADAQSDAAIHLAGVNAATSAPIAMTTAI